MRDRAARAIAECRRIAAMSEEPGQTTRRFLTSPMHEVHALLHDRMDRLGLAVRVDAAGNLRGASGNAGCKRLLLGSHIDTVPNAGAFDGVLGVTLALELADLAQQLNPPLPAEVIAFSEEEGMRYGIPFLGSRAVAGSFDPALLALKDRDGITMENALRAFGLDPGEIGGARVDDGALGFLEMHIEQGPVLESEDLPVAVVTSIAGQTRFALKFIGQANHAGTTPMHLRRDALAGAAEWIAAVEAQAQCTAGLVATVGRLELEPNAGNVIPGAVRLGFEVRSAEDRVREKAAAILLEKARSIAARRNLELQHVPQMNQRSVPMDEFLTTLLAGAIAAEGFPVKRMPSGAGHDAMVMAARVPSAMLFLRSPGGISHHPAEDVREQDVETALRVGRNFLEHLAARAL